MNRAAVITAGIIFILLVLGLWIYLLLFGTPKTTGEVFTNLGFDIASQEVTIAPPQANIPLPETTIDVSGGALKQLTTRPVAGFTFGASSTVRYVERGTGHFYEIDLTSGIETPLSRTTIPQVAEAVFSPNGNTAALTSYDGYTTSVQVGTLNEDTNLQTITLQPGAKNISFSSDEDILYTVATDGTNRGYRHNISTLSRNEMFSFNFTNIDMFWGSDYDNVYMSTKPATNLEGFLYEVNNNKTTPVTPSALGLSVFIGNEMVVYSYNNRESTITTAQRSDGTRTQLPLIPLKEKCVFDNFAATLFWCAASVGNTPISYTEEWYKGTRNSEDGLWLVNTATGEATLINDFKELSGRVIDVSEMQMDKQTSTLSFTNKLDHTLWLYDLSVE